MQNNQYNHYGQIDQSYNAGYDSGYRAAMETQTTMSVRNKQPKLSTVIIKCVIACIVGLGLLFYGIVVVVVTIDTFSDDTVENLEWCDVNYNEKDYSGLLQSLELYGTMDGQFDKYWEFVDGYELYVECQQWSQCEDKGMEGASDKLKEKLAALEKLCEETKFSTNRNLFNEFIEEINAL